MAEQQEISRWHADLIQMVEHDYESKTIDMPIHISPIPPDIQQSIMRGCSHLPPAPWVFQQDFRDKIATGLITCLEACRTLLIQTHPLAIFAHTLNDIDRDRSDWSRSQQITYASKEALKPIFTDASNAVMRECAKHLGIKFIEFARSAFMSELTGFLIEYLVDQIYTYLGGGGGDGKSFDFLTFLEELLIFLLRFFIVLLLCQIHPDMILLKSFLAIIVPKFLKYLIGKLRSKK